MTLEDWRSVQLADLCESIDYGFTASASVEPVGPRFLRITDIVSGSIDWSAVPFCSIESRRMNKFQLAAGDIVIARTGASTGASAYILDPPDAVFASYLVRLRITRELAYPRFLAYYLRSPDYWDYVHGVLGDKSAQPNASARTLTQASLFLPPLSVQRAMADVLGALDDKIDLNRRMNESLEGIARAIFRSWFVDFDPVRAKMEGRQPHGMAAEIAALFPHSLLDSELGFIPDGWRVGDLGDVTKNVRRQINPYQLEASTAYIGLEHMPRRSIALGDWGTSEGLASNKFGFERGEILFGKLRPYFHKVGVAPVDGVCSTDILVISPGAPEWHSFVLGHISSDELIAYTDAASTGTKMPRTNWKDLSSYRIVVPPVDVASAFDALVSPLVDAIIGNIHEARTLTVMRDTLLPRLVSGDIRMRGVEEMATVSL